MTRVGVAARRRVPLYNRAVLAVLRSPAHRVLDRSLVALRVRGRVSGSWFELPAMYAEDAVGIVVVPGRWEQKRWWRNLLRPAPVEVLLRGRRLRGEGVVLRPGQDGYGEALAAYQARWRRVRLPGAQPVVRILLAGAGL